MSVVKKYYHKFYSLSDKQILIFLFVLSFIVRAVYCVYFDAKFAFTNFGDDLDYISYANNILTQGITVKDISLLYGNAHLSGIGWPLILAGIFKVFGENYYAVYFFNILVSSFQVVLVYLIAKQVFNKHIAIFSGLWSVFYIKFIKYTPSILKENLLHFLFFLIIYLFILQLKEQSTKILILFIIAFTWLIHIDERYFVFFPLIIFFYLFYHRKDIKTGIKLSGIFAVATILLMIPWTIRNYEVYQRPVILSLRTSTFTDKFLGYKSSSDVETMGRHTPYDRRNLPVYEEITVKLVNNEPIDSNIIEQYGFINLMQKGISDGNIPRSFSKAENTYMDFIEFFRAFRFNGGYVANGYRYMQAWPKFNNAIVILQYGILLPFFVIGLYYFFRSGNKYFWLITSFMVLYSFVHIFLAHAVERYRHPIDGLIFILAFYGIYRIFCKLKHKDA